MDKKSEKIAEKKEKKKELAKKNLNPGVFVCNSVFCNLFWFRIKKKISNRLVKK